VVKAAAIYARISSDPEGDRLGVSRQREDCEALAARRGWPVAEVYVDDDRSAYSGKPRPEYRRMLADISAKAVDAVLVYNLDRLHRQPRELEAFFDVGDHPLVLRSNLARPGALVVVDVQVGHRPAPVGGLGATVLDLAADAQPIALRVVRDSGVDRGGSDHRMTLPHA